LLPLCLWLVANGAVAIAAANEISLEMTLCTTINVAFSNGTAVAVVPLVDCYIKTVVITGAGYESSNQHIAAHYVT
jgi:hypothetical protein